MTEDESVYSDGLDYAKLEEASKRTRGYNPLEGPPRTKPLDLAHRKSLRRFARFLREET